MYVINRQMKHTSLKIGKVSFTTCVPMVVIGTQLLIHSLAAGVCGQRAMEGRPIGQICPGTLEQLQGGFDSTLKLLLALLGGAALTRMDR